MWSRQHLTGCCRLHVRENGGDRAGHVKIRGESPFADFAASGSQVGASEQGSEAILDDFKRTRGHFSATSTLGWTGGEKPRHERRTLLRYFPRRV